MAIEIVYIEGVFSIETKDDTPIFRHSDSAETLQIASQGMQTQSGSVYVDNDSCSIEQGKDLAQAPDMRLLYAAGFVIMKERCQAFIPLILWIIA